MVMKVLPNRFPFLLVDRILTFVPRQNVVGIKNVTVNEPFFQGHWPSVPVMPGVLVIEVMAQVSAMLTLLDYTEARTGSPTQMAFLMGIDKAKFHRDVVPGDQILVEADMLEFRENTCRVRAVARIDNVLAAEAELVFGLTEGK
jgi:beta-hydroxyacyl-ACP dehydratase FabZ